MSTMITNTQEVIDSRDVNERIEELETELQDAHEAEGNDIDFDDWLTEAAENTDHTLQEAAEELITLRKLAEQGEDSPDWKYGESLIRESYFEDYARELAEDIGAIQRDMNWPCNHINWAAAADELRNDYLEIDFDGETYLIQA